MTFKESLKKFITEEFLSEMPTAAIDDDTDLIAAGVLDSLALLKIISFVEMENDIDIDPEKLDPDNLNSINSILAILPQK